MTGLASRTTAAAVFRAGRREDRSTRRSQLVPVRERRNRKRKNGVRCRGHTPTGISPRSRAARSARPSKRGPTRAGQWQHDAGMGRQIRPADAARRAPQNPINPLDRNRRRGHQPTRQRKDFLLGRIAVLSTWTRGDGRLLDEKKTIQRPRPSRIRTLPAATSVAAARLTARPPCRNRRQVREDLKEGDPERYIAIDSLPPAASDGLAGSKG